LGFDTQLTVSRISQDGALSPVGMDDDSAGGTNSVLQVEAPEGLPRFRVEVVSKSGFYCSGQFELSVERGRREPLSSEGKRQADEAYWGAVEAVDRQGGDASCRIRAMLGRGRLLADKAAFSEAKVVVQEAVRLAEQQFGYEDPALAQGLTALGSVFQAMGSYAEAKPLYERSLAIREKQLGPEHPDVAAGLNNLAALLQAMGSYAEAKPLFERSLAIWEKQLGPEHLDVAAGLNNLAALLQAMGSYAEAKPLYERSLAIFEKQLGPEHPDIAQSLNNLAELLYHLGSYAEAKPLYERSLAIREKQVGPEHSDVATSLNNLAVLLWAMGSYAEAKPLYERSLAIREKRLGPEHPDVATSLNNLAWLLQAMGSYAEAKPLYERSLAIWEKHLGPEHPNVATSHNNLANLLREMGSYAEAKPLYERSLAIREKRLAPEHPDVAQSLNNLAGLLQAMGSYTDAKLLFERSLAIHEKQLGPEHPYVAISLNNLGKLLQDMGSYAEAKPLFERSLAIKEKQLGPEHPGVAVNLHNLAWLLQAMGSYAEAKPLVERSLAIREKQLGPEHPDVAASLNNLATLLQAMGSYAEAKPLFVRSLAIREKQLGPEHPLVANALTNFSRLAFQMGDISNALLLGLRSEEIGRRHLQKTARVLPARQALGYEAVRATGLDLALSAATDLGAAARQKAFDAVIRSRALVLDEISSRNRSAAAGEGPATAALVARLGSATQRWSNLVVRGAGKEPPERYKAMLDEARREREEAEQALAEKSAPFREDLAKRSSGLDEVARSLPPGSALVAYVLFDRHITSGREKKEGTQVPKAEFHKVAVSDLPSVLSYLAFVLRRGDEPIEVSLGTAEEIDAVVSRWKEKASRQVPLAGSHAAAGELAYRQVGEELRRKIWDPVASALGEARRVFVAPDGALNLVSLAALPVGKDQYLVETGPLIHYLSAERDLVQPASEKARGEGLLAIGGPGFDATTPFAALTSKKPDANASASAGGEATGSGSLIPTSSAGAPFRGERSACGQFTSLPFEPLPGSAQEAKEIASMWKRSVPIATVSRSKEGGSPLGPMGETLLLTGPAATESAFKLQAPGKRWLHLATHGFFVGGKCPSALEASRGIGGLVSAEKQTPPLVSGENPLLLSGLVLAGANHRASAGPDEDDGILTAEEIAAMDLSGVQWAVLSACDTGVGEVRGGEGVFGLRRAFQVAGAGTLIMSLWSVGDEPTRQWMKALYEARLLKGLSTAEAVREASLQMLRQHRQNHESTHPFYWAAFVAAGDWR